MRDGDLDQILSRDDDIVPSSGFVYSVMDAVRQEAATPPAIPFPWKRAAPGLGAWVITLVAVAIAAVRWKGVFSGTEAASALIEVAEAAASIGTGWIVLALLLSFASVRLSMRLAGVRD